MFGDLLCAAIEAAGHELGARFDSAGDITEIGSRNALVVHVTDIAGGFVREIRQVRAMSPASPIVILCSAELAQKLRDALRSEVDAIIPDDQHLDLVISCLTVVEGGYRVSLRNQSVPQTGRGLAQLGAGTSPNANVESTAHLSKREVAILARLRDGNSNKEIANDLGISDSTVKVHLRSVFQKMGVRNRTQAAIWATENL